MPGGLLFKLLWRQRWLKCCHLKLSVSEIQSVYELYNHSHSFLAS